jgi:copper chaperone NosL
MRRNRAPATWLVALVLTALVSACAPRGPRAIAYDAEACHYCRMTISDARFGAEALTSTGKTQTFDSIECLASFVASQASDAVRGVWVSDWNHPGTFLAADSAEFRRVSGPAGSPMGGGWVATAPRHAPNGLENAGTALRWSDVLASARTALAGRGGSTERADAR